jgi:hypothetical protein
MKKPGLYILLVFVFMAAWYGYFGPTTKFVSDAKETSNAEQSFRNLPGLKGKKLNIFRNVSFYDDGRIYITIQDPDSLNHINGYNYQLHSLRGKWDGPYAYKLDKLDYPLQQFLVPLDSCSFATGAKIVATYNAKAKSVGSSQTLDVIEYTLTTPGTWGWKVEEKIDGGNDRESVEYKILFNTDGSVKYFGAPNGWNSLNEASRFSYAESRLKNLPRFKGKKLQFYKAIEFDGGGVISINLLDPDNAHHVLSYFYSEPDWEEDEDYEKIINKNPKIQAYSYPLDSVSFTTATKIANLYTSKAKSVGSKKPALDSLAFDVHTAHKPEWRFTDTIKGGKDNAAYAISFNSDGSLKHFARQ